MCVFFLFFVQSLDSSNSVLCFSPQKQSRSISITYGNCSTMCFFFFFLRFLFFSCFCFLSKDAKTENKIPAKTHAHTHVPMMRLTTINFSLYLDARTIAFSVNSFGCFLDKKHQQLYSRCSGFIFYWSQKIAREFSLFVGCFFCYRGSNEDACKLLSSALLWLSVRFSFGFE